MTRPDTTRDKSPTHRLEFACHSRGGFGETALPRTNPLRRIARRGRCRAASIPRVARDRDPPVPHIPHAKRALYTFYTVTIFPPLLFCGHPSVVQSLSDSFRQPLPCRAKRVSVPFRGEIPSRHFTLPVPFPHPLAPSRFPSLRPLEPPTFALSASSSLWYNMRNCLTGEGLRASRGKGVAMDDTTIEPFERGARA